VKGLLALIVILPDGRRVGILTFYPREGEEIMEIVLFVFLGILTGVFSGFLGIGGGLILIPAFVFLLGMTQHQAQGTSLAIMIPPIGLLAALKYYSVGNVNLKVAIFVCLGFFFGGYLGASLAQTISDVFLRKIFAIFLLFVSLRMLLF
jgi:hypothetical protein